ncbi:homocysteine S-methyltransferase family protein [Nocardioides kribbensis]|uniref:homocysteine S-methyltransferase family protein n=1 Tax=Nocardioides kribbensis TaxID=305517 RepID=UPI00187A581B|nr:homocysteine S-methyltransferase family protein [Nocardioides kribbensis]
MSGTPPPWDAAAAWVTDGGLETDLIFHHGVDLPGFAAFPLVDDERGRELLEHYYLGYADVARRVGAGLLLETPTWRAGAEWAASLGHDVHAAAGLNHRAVDLVQALRGRLTDLLAVRVVGTIGPLGDGYVAGERLDPDDAASRHLPQVAALAGAGVDAVTAYTLTGAAEAVGVVRSARSVGVPVAVSFTVETDGTLPDGTALADAVRRLEREAPADGYLVNCAHPDHVARALDGGDDGGGGWRHRVIGLRPNASTLSHAELDAAETLDEGDLDLLVDRTEYLRQRLPALRVLGGCCGTDVSHVAALWAGPPGRALLGAR